MRILLFILLCFPSLAFANTRDGLVLWWKMDEGTGTSTTADSSGKGYTGTLVASPTWVSNCTRSSCLKFNGSSQYVNAGTISQLTGTANASLSMWIFRSSTSTVGGGGAYLEGYRFAIQLWSDGNVYTVAENSGTLGYAYVASTVVGWNHFVLTFDGTQSTTATRQKFYINGVLQSMNYVGVNPTALGNSEFRIGMDYSAGSRYYTNPVDDVRVYNRTLTVQEVKDLYNPGMVLRGTGTTLQGTGTKFNY